MTQIHFNKAEQTLEFNCNVYNNRHAAVIQTDAMAQSMLLVLYTETTDAVTS